MKDKIVDYLDNHLSPTERQAFERQLAIDPDLQAELVVQQNIMEQLHNAYLRKQAQAQLGNWQKSADEFKQQQFQRQLWLWGSVIGIAALAAWVLLRYIEKNKIWNESIISQKPVFHGGEQAWQNYLRKLGENLADKPNTDTLKVTFIVEKDGSITNVKLLKSIGHPFDAQILDSFRTMRSWKVGRHNGKQVRVRMTSAISKQPNATIVETQLNPTNETPTPIEGKLASNPTYLQAIPLWRMVDSLQLKLAPLNVSLGSDSDKQERLYFNQKLEVAKQHPYESRYSYLPMLSNPITPEEKFVVALSAIKQKDWETAQLYLSELGKLSNRTPTLKKSVDELARLTQQLKSLGSH